MGKHKYMLVEGVKQPQDVDPKLIKTLEDKYGEFDMEHDFFSDDLKTYYKTTGVNKTTGSVDHKLIPIASFGDTLKKLHQALKSISKLSKTQDGKKDPQVGEIHKLVRKAFNTFRTHIRKSYPEQYSDIKNLIGEISTTGGGAGASTFTPGTGMQYATPKAFNKKVKKPKYYYSIGYTKVPNKIKGSGLEVKKLAEEEEASGVRKFHQERMDAFESIEREMNDIYKILSNAKNETAAYYKDNPTSYDVVKPTDLVLDYIKDIKNLLNKEE